MDDQNIIERIRQGETDAYALLVRKYHRNLLAFIHRLVHDSHLAEDIGQEVFLNVYKELPRFNLDRGVPFAAWLYIAARNHCVSHLRKNGRMEPHSGKDLELLADQRQTGEEQLIRQEELAALSETIHELPEPFRTTIIMSLQGDTVDEIALKCSVPRATVKSRLFRARERIALVLKEYFGGMSHERSI